jgi:plasmid stabilization system protein ParE
MDEEVIDEFLWTPTAKTTFNSIVEYLTTEWTEKEVQKFLGKVDAFLSALKQYPEMCRPSTKRKHVRNRYSQQTYPISLPL